MISALVIGGSMSSLCVGAIPVHAPKKVQDSLSHLDLIDGIDYEQKGDRLYLMSYRAKRLSNAIIGIVGVDA